MLSTKMKFDWKVELNKLLTPGEAFTFQLESGNFVYGVFREWGTSGKLEEYVTVSLEQGIKVIHYMDIKRVWRGKKSFPA